METIAPAWSSTATGNRLSVGPLRAELNGEHPEAGLRNLTWSGEALFASLFEATQLRPPDEVYVRGEDHVSTHSATDSFPFRTQLAWQSQRLADEASAVVLTVSLQTDLLDTRPSLALATSGAGESIDPAGQVTLITTQTAGAKVIIAPHPSDASECDTTHGESQTVVRLSPPFLEKGVIRRCRVAAIVIPADSDDSALTEALAQFAALPQPLTA